MSAVLTLGAALCQLRSSLCTSSLNAMASVGGAEAIPLRRINIITIGAPAVGKSTTIRRYCDKSLATKKYTPTIGVDFGVQCVQMGEESVRVNFWDLAGRNEYAQIRNEFYEDAHGALLVFDVSNRKSFEVLDEWVSEARRFGPEGLRLTLCANQTGAQRHVSEVEAREWAVANGASYFEAPPIDGATDGGGHDVKDMFENIFRMAYEKRYACDS